MAAGPRAHQAAAPFTWPPSLPAHAPGVYALRTADLLPRLQKWNNSDEQLPPLAAADVAAAVLPLPGGALLSLSPDAALLAACSGPTARFYSTQALLGGSAAELAQRTLPADVLRLAFRPGAPGEFAALLAGGAVVLGSLGTAAAPSQLAAAAGGSPATCLAWSPDGSRLALGAGDDVVLLGLAEDGGWQHTSAVRMLSQEVQADDQSLQVRGWAEGCLLKVERRASGLAGRRWLCAPPCVCLESAGAARRCVCARPAPDLARRWTAWRGRRRPRCWSPAA